MEPNELHQFCLKEIQDYIYEVPESALGTPFSNEKVIKLLDEAKDSIVTPYKALMELRDSLEEMKLLKPMFKEFWVVAKSDNYFVFYDPDNCDFGLAIQLPNKDLLVTIGVRGDFVGTFMAI